jgi:hypothetical protein
MKQATLVGLGVVAVGVMLTGVALARRREPGDDLDVEPTGPCCGEPVCGNQSRQPVAVPGGWRRMSGAEATPYASAARGVLSSHSGASYGTLVPLDAGVAAMVEQHCHEPGGPVKPWGYHRGVTLLAAA